MRSSGLFLVAALILTGVVAGCSETKTPEVVDKTTSAAPAPGTGSPGTGGSGTESPGTGFVTPRQGAPGFLTGVPNNPRQAKVNRPPTVRDLPEQQLEARIAKLSAYQGGDTSTPELGLDHFLQALKRQDAVAAEQLLTSRARVEAQESKHNISLAENPPFSSKAQFKFGLTEFVEDTNKTGARIPVMITDFDGQEEYAEEIIWVLGRDDRGWRVAGYCFELFKDEPWLVLNFQDLEEVRLKTQWAEAEIRRRADQQALEARRQPNPSENPSFQP